MPIKDNCLPCDIPPSGYYQHLFLGLTVVSFNAQAGWGNQPSQVDVVLTEDSCTGPKIGYNEQLNRVIWNASDQGFYGENRYQSAADSSYYSACAKADPADSLTRSAMDVVGMPVYFRVGDTYTGGDKEFEFAGVISDWVKNESATGATTYNVKIVDPRIILEGCYLIIGDYAGSVTDTLNSLCPPVNVFNIYGYGETFGVYCPSYSQCSPGTYNITSALCTSVDGPVFGTFSYGFGGSLSNENGMPVDNILLGFNLLANAIPANQNYFSPYGRVSWRSDSIPGGLSGNAFGVMDPDTGSNCFANKNFYFVDISELPRVGNSYYRLSGTVMSVMDLIETMSQDLGFDYYIELVPVQDGGHALGSADVAKFIKIRVVWRYNTPTLGKICDFISNLDCVTAKSNGIEVRNEASARFIIGGKKQTIYQAEQNLNPDTNYTLPPWGTGANATDVVADLNSYTGTVVTATGCNAIDDTILPYFGINRDGNMIIPCQDPSGYWYFDAPSLEIQGSFNLITVSDSTIQIGERELTFALQGYDSWLSYISCAYTNTWQLIKSMNSSKQCAKNFETTLSTLKEGMKVLARDARAPRLQKYVKNESLPGQKGEEDQQTLYQFVQKYARDYYGKKFAVRVPFSCHYPDTESGRYQHSDHPVNDGGWTEVTPVIGLPNSLANPFTGLRPMDFFRNDQNKITPFVRFDNPILKDISNLDKNDYLFYYTIAAGQYGNITTGNGVPSGNPGVGPHIYLDLDTYNIYVWNPATTTWLDIIDLCVTADSDSPPVSVLSNTFCPIYFDTSTGLVYIANSIVYVDPVFTFSDWIACSMSLFVRATVEEEYVYHDRAYAYVPRVVVSIGQSVNQIRKTSMNLSALETLYNALTRRNAGEPETPDLDTPPQSEQVGAAAPKDDSLTQEEIEDQTTGVGGNSLNLMQAPRSYIINAAAIPIKSNTLTYGPWFAEGTTARVEVINDAGMVPWQYNGYTNMNIAGALLVTEGLAGMERGETGSITVQGMPSLPLGAELGAVGGGFYSGGSYLVENRTHSTSNYADTDPSGNAVSVDYVYIPLAAWSGLYGPNITNINVSMSAQGLTTRYDMRSFTPRRTSLPKWNIERLQRISTNLINTIQQVKRNSING